MAETLCLLCYKECENQCWDASSFDVFVVPQKACYQRVQTICRSIWLADTSHDTRHCSSFKCWQSQAWRPWLKRGGISIMQGFLYNCMLPQWVEGQADQSATRALWHRNEEWRNSYRPYLYLQVLERQSVDIWYTGTKLGVDMAISCFHFPTTWQRYLSCDTDCVQYLLYLSNHS